jgi:pSer/pThr/pTyr-binding forkhead associated (FHA) protein
MYKLIIQDDEGKTTVVPLIRDEITIGRREGNTIRLTERNVSRKHARIVKASGAVLIEDLDSYNGIRVNGTRVQGRVPVAEADRIQIGDYLLELKLDRGAQAGDPFSDLKTQPIDRTSGSQLAVNPPSMPQPGDGEGSAGLHMAASVAPTAQIPVVDPHASGGGKNGNSGAKNGSSAAASSPAASVRTSGPMSSTAPEVPAIPLEACARLVVLSANFAGREFQLDKATLVIGRTDDNDVVIDHRSISRHHAKIVREHDHFAIVDLQSSNGVRVNGEDYGKVELRPGDQVDLGHVRLRFVEAGEAFVFDPSMVVDLTADGQKQGFGPFTQFTKKGLWFAGLGAVVLVAGVAMVLGGGRGKTDDVRVASSDSTVVAAAPPLGERVAPAAPEVPTPPSTPPVDLAEAQTALAAENWIDAIALAKQVLKANPQSAEAARIVEQATLEIRTQPLYDELAGAVRRSDVGAIARAYAALPAESSYRAKAEPTHERFMTAFVDKQVAEAQRLAQLRQCDKVALLGKRAGDVFAEARVRIEEVGASCQAGSSARPSVPTAPTAVVKPAPEPRPAPPVVVEEPEPTPSGSYEQFFQESKDAWRNGQYQKALSKAEDALNAKQGDQQALEIATIASCKLKNGEKAARYYGRMKGPRKQGVRQVCLTFGVTL